MKERSDEEKRIAIATICGVEIFNPCGITAHCKCHIESLPDYLNDISAAFQAVEWLRKEKGLTLEITNDGPGEWKVSVFFTEIHTENKSLPQAICAAFLAAMEESK